MASQTEKEYSFDYTHSVIGSTTITVTVNGKSEGVNKVYTGKLELSYIARAMVSKVIVDGTHANDYVSGYYNGSLTTFASLGANYFEEVEMITDQITKEDLNDCSLLVITAPAKQNGTAGLTLYTATTFREEFVQLVADYVKGGGKVILCGLADYKDTDASQSSTEINRLLKAMGATTRLNSDEVMDDVNYANENFRLYFDDVNLDSPYLDGFIEGMEYSCYSGSSVILDSAAVAEGKAEGLVYGHDTTYSIDSKQKDSNYVEVEKGNIVALAHETVGENNGGVWVGGTAFLSSYEIKSRLSTSLDELSSTNTLIVSNILQECQKEMEVIDIFTEGKAEEGEIFTVEGYVTAGIDIFPFSESGVEIIQKIRITGYVASYQGDKELMVMSYKLLDGKKVYDPKEITTQQATDYDAFGGSLVQVTGKVTAVDYAESILNYIYL